MNPASQPPQSGIKSAACIFAHELDLASEEADGFKTPFGRFNGTIFLIGTLTEKIVKTGNISGLRVSDPTGVFSLSMNWQNRELMKRADEIETPSFVAITGQVRFRKYLGKTYLEVVPEVLEPATRKMRDDWIFATVEYAVRRLEKVPESESTQEFRKILKTALDMIREVENDSSKEISDEKILAVITELSGKKGAPVTEVILRIISLGMSEAEVRSRLEQLTEDGECYTPTTETIKVA